MTYLIKSDTTGDRQIYLDCLRVLATFSVMILHISASHYSSVGTETFEWNVINFYDSIVRWTVPAFVMISGAIFLDRNQSVVQIYKKNIFRIIIAYIFWSTLYALVHFFTNDCEAKTIIGRAISGHYHLWFLFMIAGLYIIVPFLRKIVYTVELTKYFLALSLVFTFLLPQSIVFVSMAYNKAGIVANGILNKISFHFTLGYVCYFVCGYYLSKIDINRKKEIVIYTLGICGLIMTVVLNRIFQDTKFYENFTINVLLESISIFVFAKNHLNFSNLCPGTVIKLAKLSEYSFGAYLVHALIIDTLDDTFRLNSLSFNPIISIPVIGVIVFIISYAISAILNHIPVLNKYIV